MKGVNKTSVNTWEDLNRELANIRKLLVDLPVFSGDGSPESSISANIGAYYLDTTKGVMYIKRSGTGTTTGWQRVGVELAGTIKEYAGSITGWSSVLTDGTTLYYKDGHLFCNGASVSISTYQDLYDNIGTTWNLCAKQDGAGGNYTKPSSGYFRIPDLRGVFLRGAGTSSLADGSGDVTVTLGAFTEDKLQGHWHTASDVSATVPKSVVVNTGSAQYAYSFDSAGSTRSGLYISDGTNSTPRTGLETAPKNVGINYVITY